METRRSLKWFIKLRYCRFQDVRGGVSLSTAMAKHAIMPNYGADDQGG